MYRDRTRLGSVPTALIIAMLAVFMACVTASRAGAALVAEAKLLPDEQPVSLANVIVSGLFPSLGCIYVQQADRAAGIRVSTARSDLVLGDRLTTISGVMATNSAHERYIATSAITRQGSGYVYPIEMQCRSVGGGDLGAAWSGVGQIGSPGGHGLNTVGLLVSITGTVTGSYSMSSNERIVCLDDGTGENHWYDFSDTKGIPVVYQYTPPEVGALVTVTGIACCRVDAFGTILIALLVRSPSDLRVLYPSSARQGVWDSSVWDPSDGFQGLSTGIWHGLSSTPVAQDPIAFFGRDLLDEAIQMSMWDCITQCWYVYDIWGPWDGFQMVRGEAYGLWSYETEAMPTAYGYLPNGPNDFLISLPFAGYRIFAFPFEQTATAGNVFVTNGFSVSRLIDAPASWISWISPDQQSMDDPDTMLFPGTVMQLESHQNSLGLIFSVPSPVPDVAVANLRVSGAPAANQTVTWTLSNIGDATTTGDLVERVYVSQDTMLDANDMLLGELRRTDVSLQPGQSEERSLSVTIPPYGGTGRAYLIVNCTLNKGERTYSNSMCSAETSVSVGTGHMEVGSSLGEDFSSSPYYYFDVQLSAGMDVDVFLDDLDDIGENELYVSFEQRPTLVSYDSRAAGSASADRRLTLHNTLSGRYYFLVYPRRLPENGSNSFIFGCSYGTPKITSVNPRIGGTAGPVTLCVYGNNFETGATVSLVSVNDANVKISQADPTALLSPQILTARFDLRDRTPGASDIYDVVVTNPGGKTWSLPRAFRIQSGGQPEIFIDIVGQDLVREGAWGIYWVFASNRGIIDSEPTTAGISFPSYFTSTWRVPWPPQPFEASQEDETTTLSFRLPAVQAGGFESISVALPLTWRLSVIEIEAWVNGY